MSSGGSPLGVISARRSSSAMADAARSAVSSPTPGLGSYTNITSMSLPKPSSRPPNRPMPITAKSTEPARVGALAGDLEGAMHGHDGDVAERHARLLGRRGAQQFGCCDAEELASTDRPDGRHGALRLLVPFDDRRHLGQQCGPRPGLEVGLVRQHRHGLRRLQQQVGRISTGREQPGQALRRGRLVPQQAQVPVRRPERVADPAEAEQPRVRIRCIGEPAEKHRQQRALDRGPTAHPGRECLQVSQRALRIGVPEGLQPLARCLEAQPCLARVEPRDRLQQRAVEQLLVQAPHLARVQPPLRIELAHRVLPVAERPSRVGAGRARPPAWCACGAGDAVAAGAPGCVGNGRRPRVSRRRPARRSPRSTATPRRPWWWGCAA